MRSNSTRTRRLAPALLVCLAACAADAPFDPFDDVGPLNDDGGDDDASGADDRSADSGGPAATDGDATESDTDEDGAGGDDENASGDDGGALVPDDPDAPSGQTECSTWHQDCPAGTKCVPWASSGGTWDATKCVVVLGDDKSGEPCFSDGSVEGTDTCDASGVCWDVGDSGEGLVGVCRSFCDGTPRAPSCERGLTCSVTNEGAITLCVPSCDPLQQDCGPGSGCYLVNDVFACMFTTSNLGVGQACGFINDCAPGLYCASGLVIPNCPGTGCCTPLCGVNGSASQCSAIPNTSCVTLGVGDVGACTAF